MNVAKGSAAVGAGALAIGHEESLGPLYPSRKRDLMILLAPSRGGARLRVVDPWDRVGAEEGGMVMTRTTYTVDRDHDRLSLVTVGGMQKDGSAGMAAVVPLMVV